MKLKIEVKLWNNYLSPPHTHLGRGGGLLDLPCTQGQLLMGAKLISWTTKYPKFLLSPKINLFGLHKIAWYPWQLIGHRSCGSFASRPKIDTCVPHILSWSFSLFHLFKKSKLSVTGEKKVAKYQRKTGSGSLALNNLPSP